MAQLACPNRLLGKTSLFLFQQPCDIPSDAAADGAAGKDSKAADGNTAAAAEADPPRKAVVKPRRDRKVKPRPCMC